jgi:hypothetical protein
MLIKFSAGMAQVLYYKKAKTHRKYFRPNSVTLIPAIPLPPPDN